MKRVAIIGAGIVGSTAAYYLSKNPQVSVTVFDEGKGQATKAAAGIISPWFSKRRNKAWYKMARTGADFYQKLLKDLEEEGVLADFYKKVGVYLLKQDESKLEELYQLAQSRKKESPLIGELLQLSQEEVNQVIPGLTGFDNLLFASGGARVDGASLTRCLLEREEIEYVSKRVSLIHKETSYVIDGREFDCLILACGAWLGQILEPLGYQVDVRPQKGQLLDYQVSRDTLDYPVIMPEGEIDIIPFNHGKISVGASHENDVGFDLEEDSTILDRLESQALAYFPSLREGERKGARVGIRAYTSDFSPFYGKLNEADSIYLASGLGSSGLTTGPIIGYDLAQMVVGAPTLLNPQDYPVERYVQLKD